MSTAQDRQMQAIADLAAEYERLNQAIRRSHEAIADMRAERKLLTDLLIEVREATQQRADAMVETEVRRALDQMIPTVNKAMDQAVEKVFAKFDRLTRMITGEEGNPDRPPLEDLITKAKQEGRL